MQLARGVRGEDKALSIPRVGALFIIKWCLLIVVVFSKSSPTITHLHVVNMAAKDPWLTKTFLASLFLGIGGFLYGLSVGPVT